MAHKAQREFFERVKAKFPEFFTGKKVLDCGSLDINGNLKDLFIGGEYCGVDIHEGPNVDIVSKVHDLPFDNELDVIVSAEMLEHDEHWKESLQHMYKMLKPGGLLIISAAGKGRPEHGTKGLNWGTSPDYYGNITEKHFFEALDLPKQFKDRFMEYNEADKDFYFYGFKS
jgi:SAM-dependent methyltransferase